MSINLEAMPQLAQDKANHFLYGQAAALAALLAARLLPVVPSVQPWAIALGAAAAVGALKEWWDKASGKGDPCVLDFVATAAGGAAIAVALCLLP